MSDGAGLVFYALLLVLPISALVARRLPIGGTIKLVLAWLAIFAVVFVLVALWQGGHARRDAPRAPVSDPTGDRPTSADKAGLI